MSDEPKEFSRAVENLIAGFRDLPEDPGRSRRRPTVNLTALIDELLVKYRISHDSLEHSIREKWPELVGAANASYSHPVVVEKRPAGRPRLARRRPQRALPCTRTRSSRKLRKVPGCTAIKGLALRTG